MHERKMNLCRGMKKIKNKKCMQEKENKKNRKTS